MHDDVDARVLVGDLTILGETGGKRGGQTPSWQHLCRTCGPDVKGVLVRRDVRCGHAILEISHLQGWGVGGGVDTVIVDAVGTRERRCRGDEWPCETRIFLVGRGNAEQTHLRRSHGS